MDADQIFPGLWMGGHTLPKLDRPRFDLRVLAAMELQHDDSHQARVSLKAPLDDNGEPLTQHDAVLVRETALMVATEVTRGHQVLVTCAAGRNRSGLVVARALMFLNYPARKAINAVRARRSLPPKLSPALGNQAFVEWLFGEER